MVGMFAKNIKNNYKLNQMEFLLNFLFNHQANHQDRKFALFAQNEWFRLRKKRMAQIVELNTGSGKIKDKRRFGGDSDDLFWCASAQNIELAG